ncbi:MAG: hypothetical protein IKC42_03450 [Alistipes sp.]|nr:hypothetical protein [Alistipes sp.]
MESFARVVFGIKAAILCCFAFWSYESVVAQDLYDYRYYKLFETIEDYEKEKSDSLQNVTNTPRKRCNTRLLDYNLSHIRFMRRGEGYNEHTTLFHGVAVEGLNRSSFWRLALQSSSDYGVSASSNYVGSRAAQTEIVIDSLAEEQQRVNVNISSRNAPFGVAYNGTFRIGKRWQIAAEVRAKTGRDMHVDGLYANQATINATALCRIDTLQQVSLLFTMSPSERSTRQSSVKEVFELTNNNLYNPSWGLQNGKIRNANVRRNLLPTLAAAYERCIDKNWQFEVAMAARLGTERYSMLDWLNAQTPRPDNYRYLPSYYEDFDISDAITQAWLANDKRYTQIDFDELIARNRLQNGNSVYVIADRTSRITHFEANAAATKRQGRHTYSIGANFSYDRHRNYKQMRDLLGGKYIVDIDYYLIDDDTFSNALQNDLNRPNRKISEGDRYGYDYALSQRLFALLGRYDYRAEKLSLQLAARIGYADWQRKGFFRKELFAANSFGKSALLTSIPFTLSAAAEYLINEKHSLDGGILFDSRSAEGEDLFIQAEYNNRTINQPKQEQLFKANISYEYHTESFELRTTLFLRSLRNVTDVGTMYDDTAMQYADVVTSRINSLAYGSEIELRWRLNDHWRVSAAVSAMSYRYSSNPIVTIYADRDNSLIADHIESFAEGCRIGNAPQIAAVAEVRYYNKGWGVSLDANYAGLRYVAPSFVRRTQRVAYQASSPEIFNEFVNQQRLGDAFTIDLSLSKTFWLSNYDKRPYKTSFTQRFIDRHPRSRITIYFAVQNLLGSRNIIHNGYESSRLWRQSIAGHPTYRPQANRYLYAYPRTYYLSATFTF